MRKTVACSTVALAMLATMPARADEAPIVPEPEGEDIGELHEETLGARGTMRTRAESVSFDAKSRSLDLAGNVRIDLPPFHLRSPHIALSRTRYGIEVDGTGRLAFCPCLGTPITVEFDKAIVAPPGELILKNPKLEVYGVPILYLPWFWLRSDEKVGVLPPEIAYRGQDGFFLGEGVHIPWKDRGAREALDLRGGAYLKGGFVADVRLRSPSATTRVRYDRLPGARAPVIPAARTTADDGLLVDARGASQASADSTIAWDADLVRGRRGVVATTDLDTAAKPWDRAAASGALRLGPLTTESGVRAVTRRGGAIDTIDAAGPFVAVRSSGAVASGITYDATLEGGSLRVSGSARSSSARLPPAITPDAVSYARMEIGALGATTAGPFALSLLGRAAGDVATEGRATGSDRAGTSRLRAALPLVRAYERGDDGDPLVHTIAPFVSAAVLHARGNAILGSLPGRGLASLDGTAPITDAGVTSTLGRWGRHEAVEVDLAGGAAHGSSASGSGLRPLARGRLSASLAWLGAQVESGQVLAHDGGAGGTAALARVRLGRSDGARLLVNVAARYGVDPVLARAVTDAAVESPGGFLARAGTTGGAGVVIPWARAVTTSFGADGDASARELVAVHGGLELRDRCRCVTLRANGSHRIGREGVDVWLALDFVADR